MSTKRDFQGLNNLYYCFSSVITLQPLMKAKNLHKAGILLSTDLMIKRFSDQET